VSPANCFGEPAIYGYINSPIRQYADYQHTRSIPIPFPLDTSSVTRKPKKEGKKAQGSQKPPPRLTSPRLADIHQLARSFGLLDSTPERWGNLDKAVKQLNAGAPAGVAYKVLFLGKWAQACGLTSVAL
jgi:hypothetical protein